MRTLLGLIRDLLSRLFGGGRNTWDIEPEAATVPDEPVLRAAQTEPDTTTGDTELDEVVEVVGFDQSLEQGEEAVAEPEPEPEPPAAVPDWLPLDSAEIGAAITAVVIDGSDRAVASWREAVVVCAKAHHAARGSLPELGYTARQRSAYAYQGDEKKRFFEPVGGGWHIKTKFNAALAATVCRHLLVEGGHDAAGCGFRVS